jgi:tRNA(Phe) wybutosine-synthesizing methylase Tyw3
MESTTLEQAAESLLETSDAPEAQGDNLSEAVDEITEPTGKEVEAVAESEDDVEASDEDDDYDDQIDDEDLVEVEAEDTMLIPVKVDGKEEQWTLDQLKQSAAGQAAINKRFQEAAEARKQIEQQAAALQQQQQHVLQMYQQAQQVGVQAPVAPSRELFDSDPIGYMEEKLKYDEAKTQYDQQMYQVHQMREQQTQQQAQAQQSYLQEQAELLKQHIPEIADPVKGAQLKDDLMQIGMDYGFTAEEMAGVSDSRYVRALNDARKYRALVAKRKQTQAKGQKARPVVKAGAKKTQDGQAATRKKAQTRLQKTGSINDALSLILNT